MAKAATLIRWDKFHVWHPFTQMQDYARETPLVIESAKGVMLRDLDGNEYLDGVSSLWCNIHGHRRREIDAAIRRQLGKAAHTTLLGPSNPPAIELAKRLADLAPKGLTKVFYSDNGSTAVEIALKMAFQYWQHRGRPRKTKFIALQNGYHGDTLGAVSVGGIELFHAAFKPLLFKALLAPSPYCYRCPVGRLPQSCRLACLGKLEAMLKRHAAETAAVILEPLVQCAGGIIVQPPGYLKGVEQLCRTHNVLLILDEVATGFGRTGRMFACEHEGVRPDLMALSKGLTGGYMPLAATLATDRIYSAFLGEYREFKTFFHGHTFTGHPLGCAAALASLDIFREDRVLARLKPKVKLLTERLREFLELDHVGDVRQCGLIAGIELVADKATKRPFPLEHKVGIRVCLAARQRGILIRPLGNVIVLMPPPAISQRQLEAVLEVIHQSIRAITQ
ncbi:MAG: adenosylmethionine--8-amino-7-oxononanoate transaminase [Planctomycetes bacterium]|nr:adenosylmethionine--8-amino-7-oxononanoate transaminase [Planctomycetota bacterium]